MEILMSLQSLNSMKSILNLPVLSRIRRNHGLEHATLHVLAQRFPNTSLAGHSDAGGFWILGEVPTEELQSAVQDAYRRLQNGESRLAVHPNCGTNFATAGLLAGVGAFLAMFGAGNRWRDRLERLPLAISLATMALIASQPLGLLLQREVTTSGELGSLEVIEVIPSQRGPVEAHRVLTRG
jgi:hypothetical protein